MSAKKPLALIVGASLAVAAVMPVLPASAQPLRLATSGATAAEAGVIPVQYRRPPPPRRGWRPPPPRAHWRWGNPYWRNGGWYYRDNSGAWIAAGIAGLALGAAAASAANSAAAADRDAVAYCMQRFKSYDPRTGTYLGYDGYRHPCP